MGRVPDPRRTTRPMAALRRANGRDEPWRVPFWGIGNETWGCGGNMRAEQYADLARQYATYCRNHGGNKLYRIAAGAHDDDLHWTETLMQSLDCLGCDRPTRRARSRPSRCTTTRWPGPGRTRAAPPSSTPTSSTGPWPRARRMDELLTRHSTVMDRYDPRPQGRPGRWTSGAPGGTSSRAPTPGSCTSRTRCATPWSPRVHFDVVPPARRPRWSWRTSPRPSTCCRR